MDINPFEAAASQYKPSPPTTSSDASSVYRQKPATFKQMGRATSYISNGETFSSLTKPHYYQLAAWDEARRKEPIIKDGIDKIALSVISKIGEYVHPDPAINDFINANLSNIKRWVSDAVISAYWSGFSVGECLFEKHPGPKGIDQVWLEDIVNYHPTQINFKLNHHNRLTHGEKIFGEDKNTGIWVPTPNNEIANSYTPRSSRDISGNQIRIPRYKAFYTSLGGENNNPYGTSQLVSVLQYHLFKEAFKDMMAIALDRYGTPLIYAVVPPHSTGEQVQEPDGSIRAKTYREVVAESLEDLRSESAIVFEQINKDHPVKLEALTTGNNYADAFKEAIEMCDHKMMVGMGIPNLIVRDTRSGLGNGSSSENQVQMFDTFISAIYDRVMADFINGPISSLISLNFDLTKVKDAHHKGTIKKIPFRFADLSVLGTVVESWTALGYINPANHEDFNQVRAYLQLPSRKPDKVAIASASKIIEESRPALQTPGSIQPATEGVNDNSQPFKQQKVNPILKDPNKVTPTNSSNNNSKPISSKTNTKK